jgi:ketosteroid isomerase-like protein
MKYALVILATVFAIPALTFGQTTTQNAACEQTARDLEAKVSKITQNLDKAGYAQIVADDAVIINSDGAVETKAQQAASFVPIPDGGSITFTSQDLKIRACTETTIVITGRDLATAKMKGKKDVMEQSWWFTRIYEKRPGNWRLIYNQLTVIIE